jgi:hypothetical protein
MAYTRVKHYGLAEQILEQQHQAMLQAYLKNPTRFSNQPPKKNELPKAVYINPPQIIQISSLQKKAAMA